MKIVLRDGKFYQLDERRTIAFIEDQVVPQVGDTIQHPHDADGYALGWIGKVARALPKDLILDYGGGIDNDVYLIVEKEKEL